MEKQVVWRNRSRDLFILVPMLFMCVGGIYLLIDGRNDQFYLGLTMAIVPGLVIGYLLYKLIANKPYIIFSADGIYLKTIHRTIPWKNIDSVYIEEYENDVSEKRQPTKYYFVVFEITERNKESSAGYERKLNADYTNKSSDEIYSIANKFLKKYKI
jgi:hypothetical protein